MQILTYIEGETFELSRRELNSKERNEFTSNILHVTRRSYCRNRTHKLIRNLRKLFYPIRNERTGVYQTVNLVLYVHVEKTEIRSSITHSGK